MYKKIIWPSLVILSITLTVMFMIGFSRAITISNGSGPKSDIDSEGVNGLEQGAHTRKGRARGGNIVPQGLRQVVKLGVAQFVVCLGVVEPVTVEPCTHPGTKTQSGTSNCTAMILARAVEPV